MKCLIGLLAAAFGVAHAATLAPVQLLNPAGSTAGQAIVSTGPSAAPAWGAIGAGSLAPIAANTVLGNFTAGSLAPAANAAPSCSAANSALKYTSGTGLSCGTTFALTSGNLSQFAATTSAQLLGVLTDETGSGLAVFGTSPALTTPAISGGTINSASVGATTPSTGAFTTLSASSTVSGAGFSTYLASPPAIGGTTPAAGAFSSLNSTSGALNASIGATTPGTGAFTTISATGLISPSSTNGIKGTVTNDNANAGSIGEYVSASAAAVSLSAGVSANITSISLTAGDWDVSATLQTNPAATTTQSNVIVSLSTTSATISGTLGNTSQFPYAAPANVQVIVPSPVARISLTSTTTVFLVANVNFATSTLTGTGLIRARRVR